MSRSQWAGVTWMRFSLFWSRLEVLLAFLFDARRFCHSNFPLIKQQISIYSSPPSCHQFATHSFLSCWSKYARRFIDEWNFSRVEMAHISYRGVKVMWKIPCEGWFLSGKVGVFRGKGLIFGRQNQKNFQYEHWKLSENFQLNPLIFPIS